MLLFYLFLLFWVIGIPVALFGPIRLVISEWFIGQSLLRFKPSNLEETVRRLYLQNDREEQIGKKSLNYSPHYPFLIPEECKRYRKFLLFLLIIIIDLSKI